MHLLILKYKHTYIKVKKILGIYLGKNASYF